MVAPVMAEHPAGRRRYGIVTADKGWMPAAAIGVIAVRGYVAHRDALEAGRKA